MTFGRPVESFPKKSKKAKKPRKNRGKSVFTCENGYLLVITWHVLFDEGDGETRGINSLILFSFYFIFAPQMHIFKGVINK